MTFYSAVRLSLLLMLLSGCESRIQNIGDSNSGNISSAAERAHVHGQNYAKPGADVRLLDAAPIHLLPGQASFVELALITAKQAGALHVELRSDEGLSILSSPEQLEFELVPEGQYRLPLQLLAPSEGRFYVHLLVRLVEDGQSLGRSLAVAVQVGEAAPEAIQQQKMTNSSSLSGEDVISLPAQETIMPTSPGNQPVSPE